MRLAGDVTPFRERQRCSASCWFMFLGKFEGLQVDTQVGSKHVKTQAASKSAKKSKEWTCMFCTPGRRVVMRKCENPVSCSFHVARIVTEPPLRLN